MMLKTFANIFLLLSLALVTYLSLTPIPEGAPQVSDKLAHFTVWMIVSIFCGPENVKIPHFLSINW